MSKPTSTPRDFIPRKKPASPQEPKHGSKYFVIKRHQKTGKLGNLTLHGIPCVAFSMAKLGLAFEGKRLVYNTKNRSKTKAEFRFRREDLTNDLIAQTVNDIIDKNIQQLSVMDRESMSDFINQQLVIRCQNTGMDKEQTTKFVDRYIVPKGFDLHHPKPINLKGRNFTDFTNKLVNLTILKNEQERDCHNLIDMQIRNLSPDIPPHKQFVYLPIPCSPLPDYDMVNLDRTKYPQDIAYMDFDNEKKQILLSDRNKKHKSKKFEKSIYAKHRSLLYQLGKIGTPPQEGTMLGFKRIYIASKYISPKAVDDLNQRFQVSNRLFARKIAKENPEMLEAKGLNRHKIKLMLKGTIPDGFCVKPVIPLELGGTCNFTNMIFMRENEAENLKKEREHAINSINKKDLGITVVPWSNHYIYLTEEEQKNLVIRKYKRNIKTQNKEQKAQSRKTEYIQTHSDIRVKQEIDDMLSRA